MGEVRYSLNGKFFKDFGVQVSDSRGIGDVPARKEVQKFSWAEYHGDSVYLPTAKYQSREIELDCFIIGDNWEKLYNNFISFIRDEFAKAGTQRLMIEPFGFKPYVYEVYSNDQIKLNKRFHQGRIAATFTLKMIEPNPVKKVFVLNGDNLSISLKTKKEVEIFFGDGSYYSGSGSIDISRNYNEAFSFGSGFSIIEQASNPDYYQISTISEDRETYLFTTSAIVPNNINAALYIVGRNISTNEYEVVGKSSFLIGNGSQIVFKVFSKVNVSNYGKFIFKLQDDNGNTIESDLNNTRIELSENVDNWYNMTGKKKYIIVAGDVDEIDSIITNAEELWSKL